MHVMHVATECAPLAKVGGLADVAGALPRFLSRLSPPVAATLMLPCYAGLEVLREAKTHAGSVRVGGRAHAYVTWRAKEGALPFPLLLVESELFAEPGIYPPGRDLERQCVLAAAATEMAVGAGAEVPGVPRVDLVHVHDNHPALACVWLRNRRVGRRVPTVLTVHNARYGGSHDWGSLDGLVPPGMPIGDADHAGRFNVLKAGLMAADRVTTVSPTFAMELKESPGASHGLDYAFRMLGDRLSGILNGIDTDAWDPATDAMIEHRFHAGDLAGKAADKAALCRELGLRADLPLLAFIGRLVPEKGVDALLEGLLALGAREFSAQAIVLGSGDARYEDALRGADARLAGMRAVVRLDETMAHRLYAAADIQLVPSWYEPCGLTQMYAMRYGTVPVVNPVGGLRDSVVPWEAGGDQAGTGAWMDTPDAPGLVGAIGRALGWWRDGATWRTLQANGMGRDLSWGPPAARYADLYREVLTEAS